MRGEEHEQKDLLLQTISTKNQEKSLVEGRGTEERDDRLFKMKLLNNSLGKKENLIISK